MDLPKYKTLAIVFSISAVALALLSMSVPWYQISRTGDLSQYPDISHNAGTYDFYRDFGIWRSPEGHSAVFIYDVPYFGTDPIGYTMNVELIAVLIWVVLAILFLLSVIGNDELLNLGSGITLALASVVAVAYFAIVIDDQVRRSRWFGTFSDGFGGHGFIGHDSVWSWGPLDGWYLALAALLLQIPAVLIGIYALRHES